MNADFKRQQLHDWLSPPDASFDHNKALQQRHEGTGQWFLCSNVFAEFKYDKVPFLWLHGIPGCGKTILSSSIVEDLRQESPGTASALLYFYFDFNDVAKQTLDGALRCLIWQQACRTTKLQGVLRQLYVSHNNGRDQPSTQMLCKNLQDMLLGAGRTILVLDALDECTTRPELLRWLDRLFGMSGQKPQMILTSRKEYDIANAIDSWVADDAKVVLQPLDVDEDIRSYIRAVIRTEPQFDRWQARPKIRDDIEAGIMAKANGM